MADIFISYSRKDLYRVQPFANALEAHGWSVWWDRSIPPGKTFAQVIEAAINDAKCVVVMWSEHSVDSDWVKEEADIGKRRGVLIPTLLDPLEPPLGFGLIHAADLTDWDARTPHAGFGFLLEAIKTIIGPPPERPADMGPERPGAVDPASSDGGPREPEKDPSKNDNTVASPEIPVHVDEIHPVAADTDIPSTQRKISTTALIFTGVSAAFLIGLYFFYRFILNNITNNLIQ
jgi:hypothetical protein